MKKSLYTTLGVLPTAEDVVIRAAYKALAQRYHPDKYQGRAGVSEALMKEINFAYQVLSDPEKRREYDAEQGINNEANDPDETDEPYDDSNNDASSRLEDDWQVACSIHADLEPTYRRLRKVNSKLAETFKSLLFVSKSYELRHQIAEQLEEEFLFKYFGSNASIVRLAKELIYAGNEKASLALNNYVKVMGDTQPYLVINKVREEFDIDSSKRRSGLSEQQKQEQDVILHKKCYSAILDHDFVTNGKVISATLSTMPALAGEAAKLFAIRLKQRKFSIKDNDRNRLVRDLVNSISSACQLFNVEVSNRNPEYVATAEEHIQGIANMGLSIVLQKDNNWLAKAALVGIGLVASLGM